MLINRMQNLSNEYLTIKLLNFYNKERTVLVIVINVSVENYDFLNALFIINRECLQF